MTVDLALVWLVSWQEFCRYGLLLGVGQGDSSISFTLQPWLIPWNS